jgi:two-component system, OmpR family, KDP operon response regulator KdpE
MSQKYGAHILVVDDEPSIQRALRTILTRHDFRVDVAATGSEALSVLQHQSPDLILLDLGLPDIDGLDVIKEVRARISTPILILSVRGGERDKVSALDLGADDYLTKPFGVEELLARIRVALRHAAPLSDRINPVFRTGDLEVDVENRRVTVGGNEVHLTPTEYDLLKAFITHPNKVLTNRMLLQQVWGPEYGSEAHYLHVYIGRLRAKIEADARRPRYLIAEPGVGYRLLADEV